MKGLLGALALGLLVFAGAGAAQAQLPRSGGHSGDMRDLPGGRNPQVRYQEGVGYLQNRNYLMAVAAFRDVLQADSSNGNAHFMLGMAQIGLNDLEEAKREFAIAVRMRPNLPEPKGRLGYLLAREGNVAGAQEQKAALEALGARCRGTCPEAAAIADGIRMIDLGLAPRPAATASPAPPPAPTP
jgi:Tfp pilus assembly protein PilF